jgi:hypothetical protein
MSGNWPFPSRPHADVQPDLVKQAAGLHNPLGYAIDFNILLFCFHSIKFLRSWPSRASATLVIRPAMQSNREFAFGSSHAFLRL